MPKAGGTTFTGVLQSVYGDRLLVMHPLYKSRELWHPSLRDEAIKRRFFYRAFSGHFYYGIHHLFAQRAHYLSSVRDPVDRFESYYNFVRYWEIHHHHQRAQSMSIGEFYRFMRDTGDGELFNLQCFLICGQRDFATAREYAAQHYLAIAPLSAFEQSIRYVAVNLGWPFISVPRLNETDHKARVDQLTDADRRELVAGNQDDADLVTFCEDLMAARI